MSTRLYLHPDCLAHDPGERHPESPSRLAAVLDGLGRARLPNVERVEAPRVDDGLLSRVHGAEHRARVQALSGGTHQLDPDTAVSPRSVEAALRAAGAVAQAVDDVWHGRARNGFALVRPPGHHAEPDQAMGFCLFNNVAVGAEAALRLGAQRVAVLDWDVHHGNGTQKAFFARRDVLFVSTHQHPHYPGTGAAWHVGEGEGEGYNVNVPLPGGQGDADFSAVFDAVVLPVLEAYAPDFLLVSAGFDAHVADPLGGLSLTERGFAAMTSAVKSLAERLCGGRVVLTLEGGYALQALSDSVRSCVEVLSGARTDDFPDGALAAGTEEALGATASAHHGRWSL